MNKQRAPHGIEWTRIKRQINGHQVELPGYTWNPTAGCYHGCTWRMPDNTVIECYAKTVAERLAQGHYAHGFEHHYFRPEALDEPLRLREPAGIFVGSMADLFGHWVPTEQINQVLAVMRDANWHTFQTLSKYPIRLKEFSFPDNAWVGVSLPAGHLLSESGAARALEVYLGHMQHIQSSMRFMSIEPLWFDAASVLEKWVVRYNALPFEWAIIGAATNGPQVFQPESRWVEHLLEMLDSLQIPVFFKGNLRWHPWRDDFPQPQLQVASE